MRYYIDIPDDITDFLSQKEIESEITAALQMSFDRLLPDHDESMKKIGSKKKDKHKVNLNKKQRLTDKYFYH